MINKPLYGNSFGNLLQAPQRPENIDKQYFYNKDLNKLFNMSGGTGMAAPKGFENVNKNQYEDFASKGATLQGASMFTNSMGGGYNLDLPRLTSGPNSGAVDRNSPEYLYYHGDDQKTKLGLGNLSGSGAMIPEQGPLGPVLDGTLQQFKIKSIEERKQIAEEMNNSGGGLMGTDGTRVPVTWEQVGDGRNTMPSMPIKPGNRSFPFPGMNNTEIATVPLPSLNQFTPPEIPINMQQPMTPTMPQNTMGGNNSFGNPLMGGINNLSEFGKPPSFGGNSFGNTMGGNNVFQNPFTGFQSNQQSFNDNQGMSSYIDNLINQRMKDIFGGIMGIFK